MLSHSVVSDSLQLHLAHQDPCPWNFLGKNSGVGCHSLLQGNLPTPGMEPGSLMSPALAGGFSTTAPPGNPFFKPIKQMDLTYLIITSGARKILIHCHVEKSRKYNSSMQYPNPENLGWPPTPVYVCFHGIIINISLFKYPKCPHLNHKVYGTCRTYKIWWAKRLGTGAPQSHCLTSINHTHKSRVCETNAA